MQKYVLLTESSQKPSVVVVASFSLTLFRSISISTHLKKFLRFQRKEAQINFCDSVTRIFRQLVPRAFSPLSFFALALASPRNIPEEFPYDRIPSPSIIHTPIQLRILKPQRSNPRSLMHHRKHKPPPNTSVSCNLGLFDISPAPSPVSHKTILIMKKTKNHTHSCFSATIFFRRRISNFKSLESCTVAIFLAIPGIMDRIRCPERQL